MSPHLQTMLQQAIKHTQQNNFSQAKLLFNYILKIQPKNFDALHAMGFICGVENNHQEASCYLIRAIKINSNVLEVNMNCAKSLQEVGNYLDSIKYFQQAIFLSPNNHEVWFGCGRSFKSLRRFDEAIAHYDKALGLNPNYAEAWSNKGNTLHELKRYEEAIAHYDKALSLKPDYADVWSNKGVTLHELKRFDEAIAHYDKALSLNPNYAKAWSNKGVTFHGLKRFDEAIDHYDKALSLNPNYADAWSIKGATLYELNRYDEAITHYDVALSLKPDIDWLAGDLLHTKMKICSWLGFSESLNDISKKVVGNKKVAQPFTLLAMNDDALLHKKSSEIYIQSRYPFNPVLGSVPKYSKKNKIRIGYFSSDFRTHPVSILTAELFELHDKSKFEIIAFSFGTKDTSALHLRVRKAFNKFIDVNDMSDLDIAKLSRKLCIDIAVDLGGHTAGARTNIFAYRAAPIQVSYLGYLGTMGAEYIDCIFADDAIIPVFLQKFYTEKITYLPSYQVNDRKRHISEKKFTKEELSLPDTGFIFCCFNNNYKILPSTFDGWMRILKAVDGSTLFLYAENKWVEQNLRKEAVARGVDDVRIVFGKFMPTDEYLARYQVCDLFLDTFPYNAGTTASDALWAGLPVLTLMGQSFASRVAASLLNAIGLPELITNTQEEYEALAIELAMNPQKLRDIKLKLARNRLATPLFDTPLFTKNLETIYIKMMERYQADLQPDHITIT